MNLAQSTSKIHYKHMNSEWEKNLPRKFLALLICLLPLACSKPLNITLPFDVSRENQTITLPLKISEAGKYMFAILFIKADKQEDIEAQKKIWGSVHESGEPIEIHLRLTREGVSVFDQNLVTTGTGWRQTFSHQGRELTSAVRLIRILELTPGDYAAELRTVSNSEPFRKIESFIEISYFNPKH